MAFYGCEKLPSIYLPDTLTEIGMYAFASNYKLASIFIPASVKGFFLFNLVSFPASGLRSGSHIVLYGFFYEGGFSVFAQRDANNGSYAKVLCA